MQVVISPYDQSGDLGFRSNGQISLNLSYKVNFKVFIPNFVRFITNKLYIKHIEQNLHSGHECHAPRLGLGVKNFIVGISNGAPSTVRSSF